MLYLCIILKFLFNHKNKDTVAARDHTCILPSASPSFIPSESPTRTVNPSHLPSEIPSSISSANPTRYRKNGKGGEYTPTDSKSQKALKKNNKGTEFSSKDSKSQKTTKTNSEGSQYISKAGKSQKTPKKVSNGDYTSKLTIEQSSTPSKSDHPSLSADTASACYDDAEYDFTLFWDNVTRVKCEWLTKNRQQIHDRKATYCPFVKGFCPVACDNCTTAPTGSPIGTPSKRPTIAPFPASSRAPTMIPSKAPIKAPCKCISDFVYNLEKGAETIVMNQLPFSSITLHDNLSPFPIYDPSSDIAHGGTN